MRYCGHFLIKAEGGAKNYERDHPLPLAWRPFTVVFVERKGYAGSSSKLRRRWKRAPAIAAVLKRKVFKVTRRAFTTLSGLQHMELLLCEFFLHSLCYSITIDIIVPK